jgi:hypothetical protein
MDEVTKREEAMIGMRKLKVWMSDWVKHFFVITSNV